MKIIVIDDEIAALNTFLENIVDEYSLEYKMFMSDPYAALDYAEANKPDAAFLDINMPKVNGVDLAEELIKRHRDIKIIFITGFAQDEESIAKRLGSNLKGYCYKPYNTESLKRFIKEILAENRKDIFIRTFGAFDVFLNGAAIRFNSNKAKELMAFLSEKNGAEVTLGQVLANLWPDKNPEHAKRLYRDARIRLKFILTENGVPELVSFYRAAIKINPQYAGCDLWNFIQNPAANTFPGEYLPHYDWSMETQTYLEILSGSK
jgi:two-component SAPR family response regulator